MSRVRRQLTLFVPPEDRPVLEALRRRLDPVEHARIAAHVTLAREDELEALDDLPAYVAARMPLTLIFDRAERFGGHGILCPCIGGQMAFEELRRGVLGEDVRPHPAHLTLAHPQNPRVEANSLENAHTLPTPLTILFTHVSLIEQRDDAPCRELARWPLFAR